MKDLDKLVGAKIAKLRSDAGITQTAFASSIGISRAHFVNLEKGKHAVTLDNLYKIAYALEVEVSELLPGVDKIFTPIELPESLAQEIEKIAGSNSAKAKKLMRSLLNNNR